MSRPSSAFIRGGFASAGAGPIQTQFLPIGGIGETRCITIASDGTMLAWNDSTGAWISNTATIPGNGPGTYQWQPLLTAQNAPSSWLTAPSPYFGFQPSTYYVATVAGNSSLIYMMYNSFQGAASLGVLLKSTDRGVTWALTSYPFNANNGNVATGTGADPGQASNTIVIDPNNNSIVWASDGSQLRVSSDGGATWTAVNPAGGSGNVGYAMQYDPTTPNRLIVGIDGHGIYVSTNANLTTSATWTHITGSTTAPGSGQIGSDGTYYVGYTNTSAGFTKIDRLSTGNVLTTIYNSTAVFGFAVDPNNPARVFLSYGNGGGVLMPTTAANTTTPTWTGAPSINLTDTDAPAVFTFSNFVATIQMAFDPWTTTSSTTINLSGLSAGGSTGNITVPANIPNITVGRQLRCTNTGTPGNYFIFTVGAYNTSTGVMSGTIISSAQGGFLGGPIGGTGSFSAWTISAERIYQAGDGVVYYEGFSSTTQNIITCKFGIEGSAINDVKWPVGGNPAMCAQDRMFFQVQVNPWGLTGATGGAVKGYSPTGGPQQNSFLDHSKNDPTFWVSTSFGGTWFSKTSGKVGTFTKYTNQPVTAGGVAISTSDFIILADETGGLFYTQNGSVVGATWTSMPAPAPTSGWCFGAPFNQGATMCADRTTTSAPHLFYALNADGHIYQISVPTSGSPTVTQMGQVGTTTLIGTAAKLDSVNGNAGHLFYCAGNIDGASGSPVTSTSYTALFANHPAGGQSRLAFSSNGGSTWTYLTTTQEVVMFAVNGAVLPGGSGYPTIYAAGWCGGGTYGIYQCINFNPASLGSETWTKVATYAGAFNLALPISMAADPNQYNRFITGSEGSGAAIFESTNLTNSWF